MAKFTYATKGVCARQIELEVADNTVVEVKFIGGCSGNTQGIMSLVKGTSVSETIERLKGIDCNGKGTSCPDQLSKALEAAQKKEIG